MWQDYSEPLIIMTKTIVSDGMGGFETTWQEGLEFNGTLRTSNSLQTLVAEKQGVTSVYSLLYPNTLPLEYGQIIKRVRDNNYLKITSNPIDGTPPANSNLDFIRVTLEKYNLEI